MRIFSLRAKLRDEERADEKGMMAQFDDAHFPFRIRPHDREIAGGQERGTVGIDSKVAVILLRDRSGAVNAGDQASRLD